MAGLKYSAGWYTPTHLRSGDVSAAVIKAEYTRLRDIAEKRLKRMAKTEFRETETFKQNWGYFTKIRDMAGKGMKGDRISPELSYKMAALARFVAAEGSTISGMKKQREKSLETLKQHGFDFVNKSNYTQFAKFMQEYRQQKLDSLFDSGVVAELYEVMEKNRVDPAHVTDDFEYWLDNREKAAELKPSKGSRKVSAKTFKKRLEKEKTKQGKRGKKK